LLRPHHPSAPASPSSTVTTVATHLPLLFLLFFNDPATTDIYPLSLHDALPILPVPPPRVCTVSSSNDASSTDASSRYRRTLTARSEEHTSELQSLTNLVCRLLLEKKK